MDWSDEEVLHAQAAVDLANTLGTIRLIERLFKSKKLDKEDVEWIHLTMTHPFYQPHLADNGAAQLHHNKIDEFFAEILNSST